LTDEGIITFEAIIAPTSGAIKFDGNGGGARIQLDVPETCSQQVKDLADLRNTLLLVAIKPGE